MQIIFLHLAIILFIAFVISYLARLFKQPIIIGYVLAGIIVSPFLASYGESKAIINLFSQFGIAFLLFLVGLHLNPRVIKKIGWASLLIGGAQIVFTFVLTFLISFFLLGFDGVTSSYIGVALAFSSTIIIMKLLSDTRQLDSLYGKISIGILIIQDLVAIAALMFISSTTTGVSFGAFAIKSFLIGGGTVVVLFLIGFFILPRVTHNIAKSQELLFLFSICWCFVISALFEYLGFSIEIGALIAGVVLSISPYSLEISSKVRPLRDFFLIIFFIILGLSIHISEFNSIIFNALILSVIALILKPLILILFMALFGYTSRTNFLIGITLGQISEFSLIVVALGVAVGHLNPVILSTMTLTLIITLVLSTYMISFSKEIYNLFSKPISFLERKNIKEERKIKESYDVILFGYNRIGFGILNSLKKLKKNYLVVDFNPETIASLTKLKVPCLYGDAYDTKLLEELPLEKIQIAVSTVPDFETNILLIETVKHYNPKAIIIARASRIQDALDLYKKGANYVLTPHFLGGQYVANMIEDLKMKEEGYDLEKSKHLKMLGEILKKEKEDYGIEKH